MGDVDAVRESFVEKALLDIQETDQNFSYDVKSKKKEIIVWKAEVEFDEENDFKPEIFFRPPIFGEAGCFFYRKFGCDRFLTVTVVIGAKSNSSDNDVSSVLLKNINSFYEQGLKFGGYNYRFLSGEPDEYKSGLKGNSFTARFFATHADDGSLNHVSIDDVINSLGDFSDKTKFTVVKQNSRLKLGFSPTFQVCDIFDNMIELHSDIKAFDGGDGILSDGCGLISSSILKTSFLPYGINNGKPYLGDSKNSESNRPLPSVIQVRLVLKSGLFKGCLIVTDDPDICPEGKIILRESMKKAPGPKTIQNEFHYKTEDDCFRSLDLNRTFEHPSVRESGSFNTSHSAQLNRCACLLLTYLGVPVDNFVRLAQEEVERLININLSSDRHAAYSLVRKALSSQDHPQGQDESWEISGKEFLSDGISDDEDFVFYSDSLKNNGNAEDALNMLLAGHGLDDPKLHQMIRMIQLERINKISRCNLRLPDSVYLVGVPDPYRILKPNEVYIALPSDRYGNSDPTTTENRKMVGTIEGRVVVTRNPLYHPGDLRVLNALRHEKLDNLVKNTSGGVIFFSTHPTCTRSKGDEMSGGDYDGDLYLVMYGNSEIVSKVEERAAFMPSSADGKSALHLITPKKEMTGQTVDLDTPTTETKTWSPSFENANEKTPNQFENCKSRSTVEILPKQNTNEGNEELSDDWLMEQIMDRVDKISIKTEDKKMDSMSEKIEEKGIFLEKYYEDNYFGALCFQYLAVNARNNYLGQYCNAWLAIADRQGPTSENAERCMKIILIALDASKTGEKIPVDKNLLYAARPHYLSSTKKTYQSFSVVGKIYDIGTSARRILTNFDDKELEMKPKLDQQMKEVYDESVDRIVDLLTDPYSSLLHQYKIVWHKHLLDYNKSTENITNETETNIRRKLKFDSLQCYYKRLFEEDAKKMRDDFHRSDLNISSNTSKFFLASVIYETQYAYVVKWGTGKYPLSFCWTICGEELNQIKRMGKHYEANSKSYGDVLRSEIKYLR